MLPDKLNMGKDNSFIDHFLKKAFAGKKDQLKSKISTSAKSDSDQLESLPGIANEYGLMKNLIANLAPQDNLKTEITIELTNNNQPLYIFIIDLFGQIWFEDEVYTLQQFIKIDTSHLPTGRYNIMIENDGSFSTKQFIKKK